jgi:hypothetical protein
MERHNPEQLGPAVAILTAWANSPADADPSGDVLLSYVRDDLSEVDLVAGLMGLAGILLVRLEKATGIPAPQLMADMGKKHMTG